MQIKQDFEPKFIYESNVVLDPDRTSPLQILSTEVLY